METPIAPVRRNGTSLVSLSAGLLGCLFWVISFVLPELNVAIHSRYRDSLFGNLPPLVILFVGIPLIAVIAGIVSLRQIKKSGEAGRNSAIIGIILGVLSIPLTCYIWLLIYGTYYYF